MGVSSLEGVSLRISVVDSCTYPVGVVSSLVHIDIGGGRVGGLGTNPTLGSVLASCDIRLYMANKCAWLDVM